MKGQLRLELFNHKVLVVVFLRSNVFLVCRIVLQVLSGGLGLVSLENVDQSHDCFRDLQYFVWCAPNISLGCFKV